MFAVNRTSGELLVQGPLDYERQRRYSLVITARDGLDRHQSDPGVQVRLTSRVQVTVSVGDINDCAPHIVVNSLSALGVAEVVYRP